MKVKFLLSLLISLTIVSISLAQYVPPTPPAASVDTVFIPGGTMSGGENSGSLEATINADTAKGQGRINPNRVYALYEGEVYYQLAPINVYNPTGTLTIVGVNKTDAAFAGGVNGKTKPLILIQATGGVAVLGGNGGVNVVYGSIKIVNIHYQTQQSNGTIQNELFYCGTAAGSDGSLLAQSLTIDNSLFEFSNIDLFDCTNETGAIGGWPHGAKFRITNSYFRNLFYSGQWWGSRIFQCKHPIDTLWVENCTVTTGGLTFLQQNELTDFAYFNHNTIINNKKYWTLSPYYLNLVVTNNIFFNENWVGEDSNVVNSGQDPDKQFESLINLDTVNATNAVTVQQKYYAGDSSHYSSAVGLDKVKLFVSDNVNYYDPSLTTGYYQNSTYTQKFYDGNEPPSNLTWNSSWVGPWPIHNMPGEWLNARTSALVAAYSPSKSGGMVVQNTTTTNPNTKTPLVLSAAEVTDMAVWNQQQWNDSRFTSLTSTILTDGNGYIYGDYDPTTVPGLVNGSPSDAITGEASGTQVGITKFTDLTENFSQSTVLSNIDQLPVGALIWDDAKLAAFSSSADFDKVNIAYKTAGGKGLISGIKEISNLPHSYSLSQNYPNPFNPTTNINFTLQKASNVTLAVYNVLGQKVATLVNNYMSQGNYSFQFDASKLASGVYFYRIEAGTFTSVKKMILMK